MFTDTVTIYNRFKADGRERWQRRVIRGVNWTDTVGAVTRKTGVTPENNFTLVIPAGALADFCPPTAFSGQTDTWTVAPGDTVVLGEIEREITTTPSRDLGDLDHVRLIRGVDDHRHGGLAHLEVTGR